MRLGEVAPIVFRTSSRSSLESDGHVEERREVAVDAQDRRLAGLQMHVTGVQPDGGFKNIVESHGSPIGSGGRFV